MSDRIIRALQFIRVADETGNLSLTNISLLVTLALVLLRPELAVADVATFIATIVGYQVKRFAGGQTAVQDDNAAVQAAIKDLQTKFTAMQMANQIRR